jgi:hypothetical protein
VYKINLQKLAAFLYNEQIEKEYRKTIPFTIASKKLKYLGIILVSNVVPVALHVPFPGICEYNKLIIFSIDVIP